MKYLVSVRWLRQCLWQILIYQTNITYHLIQCNAKSFEICLVILALVSLMSIVNIFWGAVLSPCTKTILVGYLGYSRYLAKQYFEMPSELFWSFSFQLIHCTLNLSRTNGFIISLDYNINTRHIPLDINKTCVVGE